MGNFSNRNGIVKVCSSRMDNEWTIKGTSDVVPSGNQMWLAGKSPIYAGLELRKSSMTWWIFCLSCLKKPESGADPHELKQLMEMQWCYDSINMKSIQNGLGMVDIPIH